jgi:hypothetical protein
MSASVLMWADAKGATVTAQMACASLSRKTIGGATLTTVVVRVNGAAPTYCKVNGTIAPSLNFEIRLERQALLWGRRGLRRIDSALLFFREDLNSKLCELLP